MSIVVNVALVGGGILAGYILGCRAPNKVRPTLVLPAQPSDQQIEAFLLKMLPTWKESNWTNYGLNTYRSEWRSRVRYGLQAAAKEANDVVGS